MRKLGAAAISLLLSSSALIFSSPSHAISPRVVITTCTDPIVNTQVVLKVNRSTCRPGQLPAIWHAQQSDSPAHNGSGYATIRTCTSKSGFDYQFIKKSCPAYQVTTDYWRSVSVPATPIIQTSTVLGYDVIALNLLAPRQSDSPIAYYLVKTMSTGVIKKVYPTFSNTLYIFGLQEQTSYSFSIAAVSVDGLSTNSSESQIVKTQASREVKSVVIACARGGACAVGDIGPGGGIVYYVSISAFTETGTACASNCHYLELAPNGWNAPTSPTEDPRLIWSSNLLTLVGSSGSARGTGYANTAAMFASGLSPAAAAVHSYVNNGFSDWFIPSSTETQGMYASAVYSLAGFGSPWILWTSTENNAGHASYLDYDGDVSLGGSKNDSTPRVRPVRAF